MTTDEIAVMLGYDDSKHLEENIENYGEPLDKWWSVIKVLVKNYDIVPHVVKPKETFVCIICNEEMEVGEQCCYENMSCPSYTGK